MLGGRPLVTLAAVVLASLAALYAVACLALAHADPAPGAFAPEEVAAPQPLPAGFLRGIAAAAYQVEGGAEGEDWWAFEQEPGRIARRAERARGGPLEPRRRGRGALAPDRRQRVPVLDPVEPRGARAGLLGRRGVGALRGRGRAAPRRRHRAHDHAPPLHAAAVARTAPPVRGPRVPAARRAAPGARRLRGLVLPQRLHARHGPVLARGARAHRAHAGSGRAHVHAVARAAQEGVPVRGWFYWALTDDFEWAEGFEPRFGLYRVNYATLARTPAPAPRSSRRSRATDSGDQPG